MERIAHFERGKGHKKYTAVLTSGRRVSFGDKRYQQYEDRVPLQMYAHLNHHDEKRRESYRKRHSGILLEDGRRAVDVPFTPAWLSLRYLW